MATSTSARRCRNLHAGPPTPSTGSKAASSSDHGETPFHLPDVNDAIVVTALMIRGPMELSNERGDSGLVPAVHLINDRRSDWNQNIQIPKHIAACHASIYLSHRIIATSFRRFELGFPPTKSPPLFPSRWTVIHLGSDRPGFTVPYKYVLEIMMAVDTTLNTHTHIIPNWIRHEGIYSKVYGWRKTRARAPIEQTTVQHRIRTAWPPEGVDDTCD
jgi:hypothetical protein